MKEITGIIIIGIVAILGIVFFTWVIKSHKKENKE